MKFNGTLSRSPRRVTRGGVARHASLASQLGWACRLQRKGKHMEMSDVLDAIRQIVDEEWPAKGLPVLLSNVPRKLESRFPESDYREVLGGKSLKSILRENSAVAGVRLVQDPAHSARVGLIPIDQEYEFPPLPAASHSAITAADALAFARVLETMSAEEKQAVMLPASFVSRLLAAAR